MPKQVFKINAFHGGLNSSSNHRDIADNELVEATDVMVDELGKVRTMGGDTTHGISETGLWGVHTPGYGLFPFSHDETNGAGAGVLTVDNLVDASQNPVNGAYTDVALTGGTGVGVKANFTISGLALVPGSITISNSGAGGYAVGDELTIPISIIGGTGTVTVDVATITSNDDTGDDYLIASGDTLNTNAQFDIYSRKGDAWWNAIINLGAIDESAKPCFYYVDGVLRISDGNFNNPSTNNKWYGYINKKFFKSTSGSSVSIDDWFSLNQKIDKPSVSSVFDDVIESSGTTYNNSYPLTETVTGETFFTNDDVLFDAGTTNVSKIVVNVQATSEGAEDAGLVYTLTVGDASNSTTFGNPTKSVSINKDINPYVGYNETHTFTFSTTEIPMADGNTTTGVRAHFDSSGSGGDITSATITSVTVYKGTSSGASHAGLVAGSVNFEIQFQGADGTGWDKDWNVGCSFIYDDNQESLIRPLLDEDSDSSSITASLNEHPEIKLNLSYIDWNPRVVGINLYMREASDITINAWLLQCSYDLLDGTGKSYPNGTAIDFTYDSGIEEYICQIGNTFLKSPNLVSTYESVTGTPFDSKSVLSKYKTAVVANRVVYIGNIEQEYENGDTKIMGDAMIKSLVGNFDIFLPSRMIEASVRDGDEIVKLEEYADRILQFKKKKMHLINISQELEFLEDTFMYKGVLHPSATCKTDFGIAWVNKHGCYLYDGQKVNNLLEKGGRQIIKESEWESFITDNSIIGYIPSKRQLIILKDCGGTSAGDVYVYDMVTQSFTFGDSKYIDENTRTNFINDWDGNLTSIYSSNEVQKWSDASVESTTFSLITKDIDFGQPSQRKKIYKVYVTYTGGENQNINVTYSTNGGNGPWLGFDGNLNSTTGAQVEAELKPSASINNIKSLQLKFNGTAAATFEINDISIVYRLKPAR